MSNTIINNIKENKYISACDRAKALYTLLKNNFSSVGAKITTEKEFDDGSVWSVTAIFRSLSLNNNILKDFKYIMNIVSSVEMLPIVDGNKFQVSFMIYED